MITKHGLAGCLFAMKALHRAHYHRAHYPWTKESVPYFIHGDKGLAMYDVESPASIREYVP